MKPYLHYFFVLILASCSKKEVSKVLSSQDTLSDMAYEFHDKDMHDSAFFYFSKAKDVFIESNDSLNIANCYIAMAIIGKDNGDYFGAQELSLKALDYLDDRNEEHHPYLGSNYNALANATYNLKDYGKAIGFYEKALEFSTDTTIGVAIENNLAVTYQYLHRYNEAFAVYRRLLEMTKNNPREYARVTSNFAKAQWQKDSNFNAVPDFLKALHIRKHLGDRLGQNASFAHLADYYAKNQPDSALYYARQQHEVVRKLHNPDDQIKALHRLVVLSPTEESKQYFDRYTYLTDSIQQARAAAKNQFALIRYEVEKNKADNLRLQKDNAEKTNRLIGLSIVFLFLCVGGVLWYKKRKQRLELEAQNRVKETQLHLSKKIHDVVANGLYRVMTEFEYKEEIDREGMLDKLDYMYNQSRDISHDVEQQTITKIAYHEEIAALLKSFAHDNRRILIVGNDGEQWDTVGKRAKEEIKHVLQELMVNMRKHSQADQVLIRFEKVDRQLHIYYSDNGLGLPAEKTSGKGLSNTVSRMESLGGNITFVSEPGEGLRITASIPLL